MPIIFSSQAIEVSCNSDHYCTECYVLVKHKFNSCLIWHGLSLSLQGELLVYLNQHKEAADVFQEIMKTRYAFLYLRTGLRYLASPAAFYVTSL